MKAILGPTALLLGVGLVFSFPNHIYSWQDSLDGGSARRKAVTYKKRTTQTQNKRTQKFIHPVRLKPTISAKTVHALDHAATGVRQLVQDTRV
jgi:hypothetical protein